MYLRLNKCKHTNYSLQKIFGTKFIDKMGFLHLKKLIKQFISIQIFFLNFIICIFLSDVL